jgi:hypothetical protein
METPMIQQYFDGTDDPEAGGEQHRLRACARVCALRLRFASEGRPLWPRPIKLPAYWTGIAAILFAAFVVFTVVGVGWFQTAAGGYGGTTEKIIGFSVLGASLLLFLFRRIVQDGERPHWREETPEVPPAVTEGGVPVAGHIG